MMKSKSGLSTPMCSVGKVPSAQRAGTSGVYNGHPQYGPKMSKGPAGVDCKFMENPKWNKAKIDSPLPTGTTIRNPKKGR